MRPARTVSQARRRGGTFNRSIAQKSAASPQHVQRRKERTVMKVLIAGASGALGTPLTRALIAGGHEVLGLARFPESIDRLTHLGAHPILANVMDRDDLLRAVKRVQADAVIHALTALKKTPLRHQDMYATNALRDVGTTNLLAAAREVGARRFVAERSEEHTSELQSHSDLVCRLLLEKKKTEHRRIRYVEADTMCPNPAPSAAARRARLPPPYAQLDRCYILAEG